MQLNPFTLHTPTTVKEAVDLYASLEDIKLLAGGTFLINRLKMLKKKEGKTPQHIISLKNIEDLNGITHDEETITVKAMTTIQELSTSKILKEHCQQ